MKATTPSEHPYPRNMVVGALGGDNERSVILAALEQVGFGEGEVVVLHGERDAASLDVDGDVHGFRGHVVRGLQHGVSQDGAAIEEHAHRLRAGDYVVGVGVGDDKAERYEAARILHGMGGDAVAYFGKSYVESIAPGAGPATTA